MSTQAFLDGIVLASTWSIPEPAHLFTGIAFADDCVFINQAGLDQYIEHTATPLPELYEGRFALLRRDPDRILAHTDETGQECLYYFIDDSGWAVSNSFAALCDHLRHHGARLTPYLPPLQSFRSIFSINDQLVSERTPISEVRLLPADMALDLPLRTGATARMVRRSRPRIQPAGHDDYIHAIRQYAATWSSRLRALVEKAMPFGIKADITGGMDSRLVLALLAAGADDLRRVNFISNPRATEDYAIARDIANLIGFDITNKPFPAIPAPAVPRYTLWRFGNVGVYSPVYVPATDHHGTRLYLHGAGGELGRNFYANSPRKLANALTPRFPDAASHTAFSNEFLGWFARAGLDIDATDSMIHHYRAFRSRLHFGRNWFRALSATYITPLCSLDACDLSDYLGTTSRGRNAFACDLLLLLDPRLAEAPFDKVEKTFQPAVLETSPFRSRNASIRQDLTDIRVYGTGMTELRDAGTTSDEPFVARFKDEFYKSIDAARSLDHMGASDFEAAARLLDGTSNITKAGRDAAQVIFAAEIVRFCG